MPVVAVHQNLAFASAKKLLEVEVSPKSMVKVLLNNIELASNKIKKSEGRKRSEGSWNDGYRD